MDSFKLFWLCCMIWINVICGDDDDLDCDESDPYCLKLKWSKKAHKESPLIMSSKSWTVILTTGVIGIVIMNIIVFNNCQKLRAKKRKSALNLV